MITERLPELLDQLFSVTEELEKLTGRPFTPDGHLVGSIGEVLARHYYSLELLPPSTKGHDAVYGERRVEIKATFGNRVALRHCPEHLLVLQLFRDGSFKEVYNGPGLLVWEEFKGKKPPSNGQYSISLSRLQFLMTQVPRSESIIRRSPT